MSSMLIFRKEKCIARLRALGLPEPSIEVSSRWMDKCDGKEVVLNSADSGKVLDTQFEAHITWCEEVPVSE